MTRALITTACVWFISLWTTSNAECAETTRIRRPWHSLSDEDQMLYVTGFQALHRQSILIEFIQAHQKATGSDDYNIHKTAENFFWHSYWLYELENAIRALGGEYECFTLPYWDVTIDGQYWYNTENPSIDDIPIYTTMLGAEGDVDNDYCVDGIWSTDYYYTDKLCAADEEDEMCCLKRQHADLDDLNRTTELYVPTRVAKWVYNNKYVVAQVICIFFVKSLFIRATFCIAICKQYGIFQFFPAESECIPWHCPFIFWIRGAYAFLW